METQFLQHYFAHLSAEDRAANGDEALVARARHHREIGARRNPGQILVEVEGEGSDVVVYVVADDMPFLVDSVVAEAARHSGGIAMISHPIFLAERTEDGELVSLTRSSTAVGLATGDTAALPVIPAPDSGVKNRVESWTSLVLAGSLNAEQRDDLEQGLARVLADVASANQDQDRLKELARETVRAAMEMAEESGPHQASARAARDLFEWMLDDNFIFLGYREYDLPADGTAALVNVPGTGAGIMRRKDDVAVSRPLSARAHELASNDDVLTVTKANRRSTVHRPSYLDYVSLKTYGADGSLMRERRFIGLFAERVYSAIIDTIPVLREKQLMLQRHFGFAPDTHSGASLTALLQSFPRDELFQITDEELIEFATGILQLEERRKTRLFVRRDAFGRFASALVYLPRDRFSTSVRLRLQRVLQEAFKAKDVSYTVSMTESVLTRMFFRLHLTDESPETVDAAQLEQQLAVAGRSWAEGFQDVATKGGQEALSSEWDEAFPASYRVAFEVEDAIRDAAILESLPAEGSHIRLRLDKVDERSHGLRLYVNRAVILSEILPTLQQFGITVEEERPFQMTTASGRTFYMYDLLVVMPSGFVVEGAAERLESAISAQFEGLAESDAFDRLVLAQGLTWRVVSVFRAYAKYLRQCGVSHSYSFMSQTLADYPEMSAALAARFDARFNPDIEDEHRPRMAQAAVADFESHLDAVATLDADRLLRMFAELIEATDRTNFYLDVPRLSFKLRTRDLSFAPAPRPLHEIWVYSPRVEGVHLRFGDIARGGLRWSDRKEDFRTEILGLVKAQAVKNAVIVPDGAKGGFFAKQLPDPSVDRGAWFAEGQEAYRTFIRSLLDLTDNRGRGENAGDIIPPAGIVRHDDDDPYLVVAADKGTASFSDIANGISAEYDFWLGDAFASGGSVGYDHKAMGITARGAWESVKRHFAELNVDCQKEDFTAVGIGDMSGDVFGNGMLLSRHTRLVAAFDHRDIFIDPSPDAEASFEERKRLFELPRSSWQDYDSSLISAGGGVFPRSSKSIEISAEAAEALGIEGGAQRMAPLAVLKAILTAPVDLVYNGGIGTYVKSSDESNASVGDRANDALRIDGKDIRARIVGEGGNLGFTQAGRVEAALNGVLINTDAIDNSAGVDCSDHEVNIKILVDSLVAEGKLAAEERAEFLHSMTDEVGRLVLRTNVAQNILLQGDRVKALEWAPSFERHMRWLEENADLNRELEGLPSTAEFKKRQSEGLGLTAPELAVLAAYSKMSIARVLAAGDFADDPHFERVLHDYFPAQIRDRFADELQQHPLRRQIIATIVANDMVNIGGTTFAFRVLEETTLNLEIIARAFVVATEVYDVKRYMERFSELPAHFDVTLWNELISDVRRLLDRAVRWLLSHAARSTTIDSDIADYRPVVEPLRADIGSVVVGEDRQRIEEDRERALKAGVAEDLAMAWAARFESFALLDIARIAQRTEIPARRVAEMYFAVYDRFEVDSMLTRIAELPRQDRWQTLARAALRDDLYGVVADLTMSVLRFDQEKTEGHSSVSDALSAWAEANRDSLDRAVGTLREVRDRSDMPSMSVALRMMRSIVRY
ncbi:NAD-glutamate dehydrogenase [Falsarthrobacter nasiphocae]|uniref:Glutamate dehydrogenase n=1 Tax=Falsarthrobacter nasiphocae TaxID=189863 RepID=A0AAE3YDK6_9MICC|nr:NAD-glutamate dehydrogenase [Falsarthrobacter nasiphocae]MDR6891419.1 glutamate dehydrogenase [Falsarthrobacter nasiphocae]